MQQSKSVFSPAWIKRFLQGTLTASCIGLIFAPIALAQANKQSGSLTQAEVYSLRNIVQLMLQNQPPRSASLQDTLAPRDAMQTGSRSLAELIFNEGSLARLGSNSVFRFVPGLRRYQLPDGSLHSETVFQLQRGVALLVSPPEGTRAETAGGQVEFTARDGLIIGRVGAASPSENRTTTTALQPTNKTLTAQLTAPFTVPFTAPLTAEQQAFTSAAIVISEPESLQMQVITLTDGVRVFDPQGETVSTLDGGQTITVNNGQLGQVKSFDLREFYATSTLAAGLGPNQEYLLDQQPEAVQEVLRTVRAETQKSIARQDQWEAQGNQLCSLESDSSITTLNGSCPSTTAENTTTATPPTPTPPTPTTPPPTPPPTKPPP
ncbi:MAG: hypothetical protein AAFP03_17630, partial [Cyanobacteria bacterium J06598_3]